MKPIIQGARAQTDNANAGTHIYYDDYDYDDIDDKCDDLKKLMNLKN